MFKYAIVLHCSVSDKYIKRFIYAENDFLAEMTAHNIIVDLRKAGVQIDTVYDWIKLTEWRK